MAVLDGRLMVPDGGSKMPKTIHILTTAVFFMRSRYCLCRYLVCLWCFQSHFYLNFFLPFHSTQLEVSTTDFAGNLVEGPAILVITVIDQNDNRPIFKETHYTGEVLEGSPTGT